MKKWFSFSMVISRAIKALEVPYIFKKVHEKLRYVIVDEYQDINPAQEQLIQLLTRDPVGLCVVGDDNQVIYQWRGSDIENMITFSQGNSGTKQIRLLENRRSRPEIIHKASNFTSLISHRLEKSMLPVRPAEIDRMVSWGANNGYNRTT